MPGRSLISPLHTPIRQAPVDTGIFFHYVKLELGYRR